MEKKEKNPAIDDGTYVVRNSKKRYVVALVVCLIASCLIWLGAQKVSDPEAQKTPESSVTETAA